MSHQFLILCTLLVSSISMAGTLDNLEAAATTPVKKQSSSSHDSSDDSGSSTLSGVIAEVVAEVIFDITTQIVGTTAQVVAKGGINSQMRYQEHRETDGGYLFRQEGDPILPSFGYTSHWLNAGDDITAQLNRIELGYGMFGISYSENTLDENGDTLTLSNTLIHYRMSLGNNISWDFALGKGKMNGNQSHQGHVFSMPIRLRVNPNVHLEYYPTWSSYNGGELSEHQFSVNFRGTREYKYFGVTAGYKKWSAGLVTVNGVFAGLNITF